MKRLNRYALAIILSRPPSQQAPFIFLASNAVKLSGVEPAKDVHCLTAMRLNVG
jgi:hypothetical protein